MARERRRIVYNEDATLIEETPSKNTEVETPANRRSSTKRNAEIPVSSVLDAFASYTQFTIDKGNGKGKCAICGVNTQYDVRKICVNCMKQYSEQLHEKAVSALEIGDRTVSVEGMD